MLCSAGADCAAFHPYKFLFIANFLPFVGALSNLPVAFGAQAFRDFRATLERTKQRPKKKVKKAKKETEAKTTIRIVQIGCERECVSAHSFIHSFENNKKKKLNTKCNRRSCSRSWRRSRRQRRHRPRQNSSSSIEIRKTDHFSYANRNSKSAHQSQIQTTKE